MAPPPSSPSPQDTIIRITTAAARDNIDLTTLPFHQEALSSISLLASTPPPEPTPDFTNATKIDTHTHPIPPWFRALEPLAAGRTTPHWNVSDHLTFMAEHGIRLSVLSVSTPQANAFAVPARFELDPVLRRRKTVALARLLNEYVAEVCRVWPKRFRWLGVTALPHVEESVREVGYVLGLGAVGVSVLTNAEGVYPGDCAMGPLWELLEERGKKGERMVVFVHPTDPVLKLDDGRVVASSPSPLRSGLGEFYFETARALSSLTASSPPYNAALLKYPHIHWRISHGAGAFPDISERFLLGFPAEAAAAREAYRTRCWYDSAGPVWPKQIKGLMEIAGGVGQCVFGTDWPYGVGFWDVGVNIRGLVDAEFLDEEEREGVSFGNAERLWDGRLG